MTPHRPPLTGHQEADVVVLGGGLTGSAAALEMSRRGMRVIVLESRTVGWATPASDLGLIPTGPALFYTEAIRRWGREGAREVWETQRENHARLRELLAEWGDDCGHRALGGFVMAEDRDEGTALAESEDLLREDGFSGEFLDHYMIETRFDVRGFAAAYWAADDGEVDPSRLVRLLARGAEDRGARVHEGSTVVSLEISPREVEAVTAAGRVRAPWVFVAAGAATAELVPLFKPRLEVFRRQALLFEVDRRSSVPSPAGLPRLGACWRRAEEGLVAASGPAATSEAIQAFVRTRMPVGRPQPLRLWAATTARSADGLPYIGRLPGLPVVTACGYGGLDHGYALLACRWAVEALVTGDDPTPGRFRATREPPVV